jgi:hypothetical protein
MPGSDPTLVGGKREKTGILFIRFLWKEMGRLGVDRIWARFEVIIKGDYSAKELELEGNCW